MYLFSENILVDGLSLRTRQVAIYVSNKKINEYIYNFIHKILNYTYM